MGTLTAHDAVITSLKDGQESMDIRMTTVTDKVQKQMDAMNTLFVNLQNTLLRLVGVPEADIVNTNQCAPFTKQKDIIFTGT